MFCDVQAFVLFFSALVTTIDLRMEDGEIFLNFDCIVMPTQHLYRKVNATDIL